MCTQITVCFVNMQNYYLPEGSNGREGERGGEESGEGREKREEKTRQEKRKKKIDVYKNNKSVK